jgi:dipeptidyl-peptidase-4
MPGFASMQAGVESGREWKVSPLRGQWVSNTEFKFEDLEGSKTLNIKTGAVVRSSGLVVMLPQPVPQQMPERGRQFARVTSPDGKRVAEYRDGNVVLIDAGVEKAVTVDGSVERRRKFGTGSWVYGEELDQRDAMGFSPNGRFLWYYGFDESKVALYYLTLGQLDQVVKLDIEAYPKPGLANPEVSLYVYDCETGRSQTVKVRAGEFDHGVGHYVYGMAWLSDSSELTFHRMDRQQKVREVCGFDPLSGSVRVIDREENRSAWVEAGPIADLAGGRVRQNPVWNAKGFQFLSESNGFLNLYELDIKAGRRKAVTQHQADFVGVVGKSPDAMFYRVADGVTPYHHTIYRSMLDGSKPVRLTDPKYAATGTLSPDGKSLAVVYQSDEVPPFLVVLDGNGKELARPTVSSLVVPNGDERKVRWLKFKTLDGSTDLWGEVQLPSFYRSGMKLPVLFSVYGGPGGLTPSPVRFEKPSAVTEAGFAMVDVFVRGGSGRGRSFRQSLYRKMGIVEIDDFAALAKVLPNFEWADASRVGIFGTSYGGYSAAMAILRYPDFFHAAVASSMVSDWRNYDTTYTERYMDLLENNLDGYVAGSAMTYAANLKGALMIYYGTADNNTHPSNSYQLSHALIRAGKSHEVQVGVDAGHTGLNFARMMEFFTDHLVKK